MCLDIIVVLFRYNARRRRQSYNRLLEVKLLDGKWCTGVKAGDICSGWLGLFQVFSAWYQAQ